MFYALCPAVSARKGSARGTLHGPGFAASAFPIGAIEPDAQRSQGGGRRAAFPCQRRQHLV